ncbi:unnamed protein product [Ostreobium quekettii]|uniref:Uncharacterized protein n=1 Tax=Ostreobium quekettii TaxID=121088 RepID=A0A8S1IN04_9CHLO|nr:unnamed protein product [Ostreobium quekettii]|eukprot:evm.model.scf_2058EXC.2 EVM.evm.TU.scf_2058EXC.2   scf_2058EXC:8910-10109(-)
MGQKPRYCEVNGVKMLKGQLVSPHAPGDDGFTYWGYTVRIAPGFEDAFSQCPSTGGYDLKIGTSEHGDVVPVAQLQLPAFKHLIVGFGGPQGLERCCETDVRCQGKRPEDFFDMYLNTCPKQGSRTIRTEEAMWISLAYISHSLASQDPHTA